MEGRYQMLPHSIGKAQLAQVWFADGCGYLQSWFGVWSFWQFLGPLLVNTFSMNFLAAIVVCLFVWFCHLFESAKLGFSSIHFFIKDLCYVKHHVKSWESSLVLKELTGSREDRNLNWLQYIEVSMISAMQKICVLGEPQRGSCKSSGRSGAGTPGGLHRREDSLVES